MKAKTLWTKVWRLFPVVLAVVGLSLFAVAKPERNVVVYVDAPTLEVRARAGPEPAMNDEERALLTQAAIDADAPVIVEAPPIVITHKAPASSPGDV